MDNIIEIRQSKKMDHMGCLGSFNPHDDICRDRCALVLRCLIVSREQELQDQFESWFEFNNMSGAVDSH